MSGLPPLEPLAATGFARAADEYERARPGYAAAAVAWIAARSGLGPGATVVDVGAGTGKWTRLLAKTGARVIAVEPVAEMRAVLQRLVPDVEALDGRAEALPVADGSARVVTAAQAYHWFADEAPAELARVLEPGGWLAIAWNRPDPDDPLQARLQEIHDRNRPAGSDSGSWETLERSGRFGPLEERLFPHVHRVASAELVTRTASISYVAAAEEAERERILDEVRAIAAGLPPEVELHYVTMVYLAVKR